jgi:hypothetical protein
VIAAYKASKYYDPKPYAWSGGTQPGDPLMVARPGATGGDSLPLTIMEKALVRAKSAPGVSFPDAVLTDVRGNTVSLSDCAARWCWWTSLRAAGRSGKRVFRHGRSLEPLQRLGIRGGQHLPGAERFRAGSDRVPWSVVAGAPALTRPLGIFGETTSYLLDQNGMVMARNLRGQDLVFAVRRALGK